jgi:hypothetical protein
LPPNGVAAVLLHAEQTQAVVTVATVETVATVATVETVATVKMTNVVVSELYILYPDNEDVSSMANNSTFPDLGNAQQTVVIGDDDEYDSE